MVCFSLLFSLLVECSPPTGTHGIPYLSESRLRINAASGNVTHALEKKTQEFGIYKTSYPDGTPCNPAISDKTNWGFPVQNNGSFKLTR